MESERKKVGLAVIENDGWFLLIRRKKEEGNLVWAFPGGWVETDEVDTETAVRETKEETGIDVLVREKLFERKHPDTGVIVSYISCGVLGSLEPHIGQPEEIAAAEWVIAQDVIPRFTSDVHPLIRTHIMSHVKEDFI